MVAHVVTCPYCHQAEPVIRFGTNRSGSARCRCKDCCKTFTPASKSRKITADKERQIERALEERLSIEATARLLKVAKRTIYQVLKKNAAAAGGGPDPDEAGRR
jgi:transposase-like protein